MRAPEMATNDPAAGVSSETAASSTTSTSRRSFLKVSAAGASALVIGTYLPFLRGSATAAAIGNGIGGASGPASAADLNAFVRVAPDDTVTVICKHFEMGQGTTTGLSTLVAEELDAAWSQMRFEFAPNDASVYNNLFFGPVQATGGSSSIANSFEQMRRAGATVRAMLVQAAADRWGVPAAEISVAEGVVSHPGSGSEASFGELVAAAAELTPPAPESVTLKSPDEWTLIGTEVPRLDSHDKTTGAAEFALDVRRPGMLRAVVARAPKFGATVASFDPAPALAIDGVTDVVQIHNGVAVLAIDSWAAIIGKRALDITWDESGAETRSSAEMLQDYRALADGSEYLVAEQAGDADGALAGAAAIVEAEFTFPYLVHAPMEPMSGVIELGAGTAEIWSGSQIQTIDAGVAAQVLGIDPANVTIHTTLAGGSFGRRGNKVGDWTAELAAIAKAIDGRAPVQLVWTREDDVRGGYYRPMVLHRVRAGVGANGGVAGWRHRIVTQSIVTGTAMEPMMVQDGVDHSSVEGAADTLYGIEDMSVELTTANSPVSTLWWRSVGHTHTAFVMETMMDELARAAGRDPVEFRLAHLGSHPRAAACLDLAAEKAGWGDALEGADGDARRGRGVAYHYSFNTHCAEVVDVTVDGSDISVDRVVAAVDCGIAVNPDVIRAQVEGAIGFAVSAALRNAITLGEGGAVEQSNFHDYEPTRMRDMPTVEVHIVQSAEAPTGIGEPGVPPLAPAIANAVFAATGERLRNLPLRLEG